MKIKYVSFDCYGTIIDWVSGIKHAFIQILGDRGEGAAADLFQTWSRIEFRLIQGTYKKYSDILKISLRRAMEEHGLSYAEGDGERLVASLPRWPPFPDSKSGLQKIKELYKIAVISNIDRDLISATLDNLKVAFDTIVTAEDVKAYKPDRRVFQKALKAFDCEPHELLHASAYFQYDLDAAKKLGIGTVWVRRKDLQKPAGSTADYEFKDFHELAALLGRK